MSISNQINNTPDWYRSKDYPDNENIVHRRYRIEKGNGEKIIVHTSLFVREKLALITTEKTGVNERTIQNRKITELRKMENPNLTEDSLRKLFEILKAYPFKGENEQYKLIYRKMIRTLSEDAADTLEEHTMPSLLESYPNLKWTLDEYFQIHLSLDPQEGNIEEETIREVEELQTGIRKKHDDFRFSWIKRIDELYQSGQPVNYTIESTGIFLRQFGIKFIQDYWQRNNELGNNESQKYHDKITKKEKKLIDFVSLENKIIIPEERRLEITEQLKKEEDLKSKKTTQGPRKKRPSRRNNRKKQIKKTNQKKDDTITIQKIEEPLVIECQNLVQTTNRYSLHPRVLRWLKAKASDIQSFEDVKEGEVVQHYAQMTQKECIKWKNRHCLLGLETLLHPDNEGVLYWSCDRGFGFLTQIIPGDAKKGEFGKLGVAYLGIDEEGTVYHMMFTAITEVENPMDSLINDVEQMPFNPDPNGNWLPSSGSEYVMNFLEEGVVEFTYGKSADHIVRVYPFSKNINILHS